MGGGGVDQLLQANEIHDSWHNVFCILCIIVHIAMHIATDTLACYGQTVSEHAQKLRGAVTVGK